MQSKQVIKSFKQYGLDVKISEHRDKDFGDMTKEVANNYIQSSKKYELTDRIGYLIQSISSGSIF